MKLWIDDVRPAPDKTWLAVHSVNQAKQVIESMEYIHKVSNTTFSPIELIDIDHDAGEYASDGGDYIRLLDWLEETGRNYPIHIHSANPVGVANMRRIIERNGWKEIK